MRKGSVCIAQYYASLLPPTLQRAKPGDVFVYGQSGACNSAEGTVITDHRDHQHHHHYHHHRCRRRRRPALPSQPHTSALATGSIATGDEERGGYVCLCGCAVGFVSESVCVCVCVAARHIHQQFVSGEQLITGCMLPTDTVD